jgi:drug/metabolite transporter (DMT)-like permease
VGRAERTVTAQRSLFPAELAAVLIVVIWGTSFSFQKIALEQFNVLGFIALRYLGMLVLSWTVLFMWQRRTRQAIAVKREDLPALALTAGFGYALYIPLSTVGLNYTTAFSNALLIATAPLFAALLLRMLRLETIGPRHYLGMLLSLAGVVLFVVPALHIGAAGMIGDLVSLAGALCFAAYTVTSKPLLSRYPLLTVMTYTLSLGTVPVILVLAPQILAQDWTRINAAGWAAFGWTVVVPVYVAWTIWSWTITRIGVARSTLFMHLVPIVGGLMSWLLGEGFGAIKIAGAALTLAGLVMARRTETANPVRPLAVLFTAAWPRPLRRGLASQPGLPSGSP